MATSVKDLMAAANAVVPTVTADQARALIDHDNALIVDVRDGPELAQGGKLAGAVHVSRGMLEFRADPASPYYDPAFQKDRPIIVYCASGGRACLAGKTLTDLGYQKVHTLGGFKAATDAGMGVEPG